MGSPPASYGTLMTGTSIGPHSSSASSVVREEPRAPWPPLPPWPQPTGLSPVSAEAQWLLWQSLEGHRLSRRGLGAGWDPLAAVPLEALVGGAAAVAALQPGPRRNSRHRNKRQRGERRPGLGLEKGNGGQGACMGCQGGSLPLASCGKIFTGLTLPLQQGLPMREGTGTGGSLLGLRPDICVPG